MNWWALIGAIAFVAAIFALISRLMRKVDEGSPISRGINDKEPPYLGP